MKWALCADLQFDEYARLSTLHPTGLTTRLLNLIECWRWIVETSRKASCDGIFILGDVFNSRTEIPLGVLDIVCREFHEAAEDLKIIVIVGNHDSLLRSPERNSLQVFRGYAQVIEKPHTFQNFLLMPWMEDFEAYRKAVDTMSKKSKPDYLLSHIMLEEAGYPGKGIPLAYLHPKRFKHILLGDVHDPKVIAKNVRYVGSPLQIDFRDAGQTRGFLILNDKNGHITDVCNTFSPRFHMLSNADVSDVGEKDFVRVKTENPADALAALEAAQKVTPWVEGTIVETDDKPPRIAVHTKDTDEEVLGRYASYQGRGGDKGLVNLGLEILKEARG
jgi:DNA repair exonuclease SbcCD nuclease subunit